MQIVYYVVNDLRFSLTLWRMVNKSQSLRMSDCSCRMYSYSYSRSIQTAKAISGVLSYIFQQSYDEGTVPSDWSTASVSAIYKKGDKSTPSNDRPVSLTCITCKIMENIVYSQIGRHLDYNNILNPNQHGFRKGISCETPLVSIIHELAYSINRKNQTDVIFLDLSKSFDKVSRVFRFSHSKSCRQWAVIAVSRRPLWSSKRNSVGVNVVFVAY